MREKKRGPRSEDPTWVRTQKILYGDGPHRQPPRLTSLVDDLGRGSDPPIKRDRVTMNSLRENLENIRKEVGAILLGEQRDITVWDRMNDWCEDQLLSWGSTLDRHYGLWVVGLLVFLALVLSIALTVRLI